jgi:hypothetical protein
MSLRLLSILMCSAWPLCVQAQPKFPVVSKTVQEARDDDRRMILQTELAAEREALAKAQAAHDGGPTKERVAEVHRRTENVNALQRELGRLVDQPASRELHRVAIKAVRPGSAAAIVASAPRFWDPYNRGSDTTDSSINPRGEEP